ncbi:MAG: C1 family peptidase, partial [Candidatus Thermoplasmatota archaeon]|nr:C1 family peptidase [Candidatus Thermoplasmatota archaeon]
MRHTTWLTKGVLCGVMVGLLMLAAWTPVLSLGAGGGPSPAGEEGQLVVHTRLAAPDELSWLRQRVGVYEEGRNYNLLVDGHGTGLAPPTHEDWEAMDGQVRVLDDVESSGLDGAPAAVDNSQDVWFPPIGNQDGEGSCVCFAVGYYAKTYQEAREHNWDLSGAAWEGGYYGHPSPAYQDRIMSPDFIYHQILYWDGDDGGSTYYDAMSLVRDIGCSSWESMPYDPTDSTSWPGEAAWREAPLYRGQSGYTYAYATTDSHLEDLKTYLSGDHLAVISVNANYYSSLTGSDLWTVDNYDGSSTNHANTIVGYDDNFGPYTEEGATRYGAFKVANSWGTGGWENIADGFYW